MYGLINADDDPPWEVWRKMRWDPWPPSGATPFWQCWSRKLYCIAVTAATVAATCTLKIQNRARAKKKHNIRILITFALSLQLLPAAVCYVYEYEEFMSPVGILQWCHFNREPIIREMQLSICLLCAHTKMRWPHITRFHLQMPFLVNNTIPCDVVVLLFARRVFSSMLNNVDNETTFHNIVGWLEWLQIMQIVQMSAGGTTRSSLCVCVWERAKSKKLPNVNMHSENVPFSAACVMTVCGRAETLMNAKPEQAE